MMSEDLAAREWQVSQLRIVLADNRSYGRLLREKMQVLERKLDWHEQVRDCVSETAKFGLRQGMGPVIPEWIIVEGHQIASLTQQGQR